MRRFHHKKTKSAMTVKLGLLTLFCLHVIWEPHLRKSSLCWLIHIVGIRDELAHVGGCSHLQVVLTVVCFLWTGVVQRLLHCLDQTPLRGDGLIHLVRFFLQDVFMVKKTSSWWQTVRMTSELINDISPLLLHLPSSLRTWHPAGLQTWLKELTLQLWSYVSAGSRWKHQAK